MTTASPAPVEIPGDTECAACNAKCPADCYLAGPRAFNSGEFVGAPLCRTCANTRGGGDVANDIRSRGGWPRKQAEVSINVFRQTVSCDDCGQELDALQACKRTRVVNGRKEYVPGTFCASCPSKPAVPERPKLSADGFLDRAYLDEQTAKRIPSRDAARLKGAQSKHHQALAALDVKSGRPRYAETSVVWSTPGWESE